MENEITKYPVLYLKTLIKTGEYAKAVAVGKKLLIELKNSPHDLLEVYTSLLNLRFIYPIPHEEITKMTEKALTLARKLGNNEYKKSLLRIRRSLASKDTSEPMEGSAKYLKALEEISKISEMDMEHKDYYKRILEIMIYLLDAERGAIYINVNGHLRRRAYVQLDPIAIKKSKSISKTVLEAVKKGKHTIILDDAQKDPRFKRAHSVLIGNIKSVVAVALTYKNKLIGVVYLDTTTKSKKFMVQDKNFIELTAKILSAAIGRNLEKDALYAHIRLLKETRAKQEEELQIIHKSAAMQRVIDDAKRIAGLDVSVLIQGETGTGKGMLARFIHSISHRRNRPFVQIDLGGMPYTLLESQLFGYKKGAFTGAYYDTPGLLEIADEGTAFFDELANIVPTAQKKLLIMLDEKKFRRVGDGKEIPFKARTIFASNKNIDSLLQNTLLRPDFYYRIKEFVINIPPLRERPEDIIPLAEFFATKAGPEVGKEFTGITARAQKILLRYSWPGNVRELRNVIKQAMILSDTGTIDSPFLSKELTETGPRYKLLRGKGSPLKKYLMEKEKEIIMDALREAHGNILAAAELLNTNRMRMYRIIRKYKINVKSFKVKGRFKRPAK